MAGQVSGKEADSKKTRRIGTLDWYTEENSLEEILEVARNRNLPVLALFSSAGCGPCQSLARGALAEPGFAEMQKEAVLLFIESMTKMGEEWFQRFKINGTPTFKVFAPNGVQWEENGVPSRTVTGLLDWIRRVKAGDNLYCLREKVAQNPQDRHSLVMLVEKERYVDGKQALVLTDRALEMNNNIQDDLTHQVMESRAQVLYQQLLKLTYARKGGEKAFAHRHLTWMETLLKAYAPDNFRYTMAQRWASVFCTFFNCAEEWAKTTNLFESYLAVKQPFEWERHILLMDEVIKAYYQQRKEEVAATWLGRLLDLAKSRGKDMTPAMGYGIKDAVEVALKHRLSTDRAGTEKWLENVLNRLGPDGFGDALPYMIYRYGVQENLAARAFPCWNNSCPAMRNLPECLSPGLSN
jgi:thiol-disulfide isomerase/thioredoxin